MEYASTGVGTLDKTGAILDAIELGPQSLADLCLMTGIPRPTCHRLAQAMERLGLLARTATGRYAVGPRIHQLHTAASTDELLASAGPSLRRLRDATGESAQLYRRQGNSRVCVAASDAPQGLRDTVPVGSRLTLDAGSAAQVFVAWTSNPDLSHARFDDRTLFTVRRRGWAESTGEREAGVASVSAPLLVDESLLAVVSISGPLARLGRTPGRTHAATVVAAAAEIAGTLTGR